MNIDIEQLKLILSTVEGLGAETATVAIWYFVLAFVGKLLGNAFFVGTVVYICYRITQTVMLILGSQKFFETVAKRLKIYVGSYGISRDGILETQDAILELISKGKWEEK